MKLLNISTGFFCFLVATIRAIDCLKYEKNLEDVLAFIDKHIAATTYSSWEFPILLITAITFGVLFVGWLIANILRKQKFKLIIAALTMFFALVLFVFDNVDHDVLGDSVIVGGEIID